MRIEEFECPNCGAIEMEIREDQRLGCLFCGSAFGEATRICPECGYYNEAGARHCAECGVQIVRDCPACGADNWVLADHCVQCGRNMDLIDEIAHRWQQTTQRRLSEQRAAARVLKAQEAQASQERMATLLKAERMRQEALTLARASQRERDRRLYVLMGVAVVIFVCVLVVALLLGFGGG